MKRINSRPLMGLVLTGWLVFGVTRVIAASQVVGWGDLLGFGIPADLTNVVAIATGNSHHLALRRDGIVTAWGDGSWGQTNVPPGLSNVVAIAAGQLHSVALKNDGTLAMWGDDGSNQLDAPSGLSNIVA